MNIRLSVSGRTPASDIVSSVFRPVQYLGCKLRSLEFVVSGISAIAEPGSAVADIFTGTTVVAQALATRGYRVIASDSLDFCTTFGRALLGVGCTRARSPTDLVRLVEGITSIRNDFGFDGWHEDELRALDAGDADQLFRLYGELPQIWRPAGANKKQERHFAKLGAIAEKPAFDVGGLVTSHYAGTYFGVHQALDIDRARIAIENLLQSGTINEWETDVLLTALLSAMSHCVFSPGKHFAQAHLIHDKKDLEFHRQRLLDDRNIDLLSVFKERVVVVSEHGSRVQGAHVVHKKAFEELLHQSEMRADVLYVDPPYTAQQYSRFYHVPEVVAHYLVPTLQTRGQGITRGLYPVERKKSRFCSKRQVVGAFEDVMRLARQAGASVAVSYSASVTGITGNDRMISLAGVCEIARGTFSRVEVAELDHSYRQFNQSRVAMAGRSDKEFLILGSRPC